MNKKGWLCLALLAAACDPSWALDYDFRARTAPQLEPVSLPSCVNNPRAWIIRTAADWKRINDPAFRVFCVTPGNYRSVGLIVLTADGTPTNRRWIRWFDPANPADTATHPVDMPAAKRAVINQILLGDPKTKNPAHYWTLDRLTITGFNVGANRVGQGTVGSVLNRLLIENAPILFLAFDDGSNNTLQNSVLRNAIPQPKKDVCLIYFNSNASTKILHNELYNAASSAIQIGPGAKSGHLIAGNEIYITPDLYTDCRGHKDPHGECAASETGIVLKGPHGAAGTVLIQDNVIWGMRKTDTSVAGTGGPGEGISLGSGGLSVDNVAISNNAIFGTGYGVYVGAHVKSVTVNGNVFYDIRNREGNAVGLSNGYGDQFKIFNNTFVDTDVWAAVSGSTGASDMQCNRAINGGKFVASYGTGRSTMSNNYVFNSQPTVRETTIRARIFPSALQSKSEDVCLTLNRLTGPKAQCLPGGRTSFSPDANCIVK